MENSERLLLGGLGLFPTLGISEISFYKKVFSFKIKQALFFSCTNIIPALIINYTINCEITRDS